MSSNKCAVASLVFLLAICAGIAHAADDGLITKPSKYSVNETVTRFEAAVKQKEAAGFMVFAEIDHAQLTAEILRVLCTTLDPEPCHPA